MTMIDHPEQVERLMERLSTALPIPARLTPEVQMTLQQQRGVASGRQMAANRRVDRQRSQRNMIANPPDRDPRCDA
jgi:hypothetical protein